MVWLAVVRKDLQVLAKDTGALSTLFLMPLVFILVFGFALGGQMGGGEAERKVELPVVYNRSDPGSREAVSALSKVKGIKVEARTDGRRLSAKEAEKLVKDGDRSLAIVFPPDFSDKLNRGQEVQVKIISDPAADAAVVGPIQGTVGGVLEKITAPLLIQKSIAAVLGQTPSAPEADPAPSPPPNPSSPEQTRVDPEAISKTIARINDQRLAVVKLVSPPGMKPAKQPTASEQNVPGYTTMFVFFIALVIGESMLREKSEGTFRRLLAAPISKASILAGKLVPYYLINLLQIAIMFGIGRLVFNMSLGRSVGALVLLSMAVAAAATSLGLLISALAKTNAQVNSIGVLVVLLLAAIGGSMIPQSIMPQFMQDMGRISPHSWALTGFQDIIVRGYGISEIWREVGALLAFAAAFFVVGLVKFKFD